MRILRVEVRAYTRVWFENAPKIPEKTLRKIQNVIGGLRGAVGQSGDQKGNVFFLIDEAKLTPRQKPLREFLTQALQGLGLGAEAVYLEPDPVWVITITLSTYPSEDTHPRIQAVPGSSNIFGMDFLGKTVVINMISKPSPAFLRGVKNAILG